MFKKVTDGIKNYLTTIKPMTFKQKLSHTWEYYKSIIITAVVLAFVGVALTSIYKTATTKIIVAGVGINRSCEISASEYLTTEFYELKKTGGREKAEFTNVELYAAGTTDAIEATYDTIQSIVAQVSAKNLDYIITDEVGFEFCLGQELYMDLREFLSEDELLRFKDSIVYGQEEGSDEQIPFGIKINDAAFVKKHFGAGDTFFCVTANTPRKETTKELFYYLLDYKE